MRIAVVGTGYVGLVSGACFAEIGHTVVCVDVDESKIALLRKGIMPFFEPGLDILVKKNVLNGNLSFAVNVSDVVDDCDIFFICVGTPPRDDGSADLSFVESVAREIARKMKSYKVIVEKSTVPVETGARVKRTLTINNINKTEFDVVSNPEFLREGTAIYDFMNPDRIVVGVSSSRAEEVMRDVYKPLNAELFVTDIKSAELIKHASNAFLSMKISYANALANICELSGADVKMVADGIGMDKRIGRSFLNAGIGYGGFCFPKDLEAFIHISGKLGYDFKLLKAVKEINDAQRKLFIKKVEDALWILKDKKLGVLGLAFKPNTDDMRFAPSIEIIEALQKEGAILRAYDPEGMPNAKKLLSGIDYCNSPYEVAEGVDALLILTEWDEFRNMDLLKAKSLMNRPLIIDGRNLFDPEEMRSLGFEYVCMGRP